MLIKVISPEACEKIATLLRPNLRSVPKFIYIYNNSTFLHWKNNAITTVKVSIVQLDICNDSLEIMFVNPYGVPFDPVVIPIEYE
jgi:hypothetical protein